MAHLGGGNGDFMVDEAKARSEIGIEGFERLQALVEYLGQDIKRVTYRYAPSIVTRSEAELWGISQPRFAIRAYIEDGGFINVRRLQALTENVRGWSMRQSTCPEWQPLPDPHLRAVDYATETPKTILRKSSSIGDSLLKAPKDLQAAYHVLDVNLGWCYGESRSVVATPYMMHVRLSGLCAQAVCLMAACLLHDYPIPQNPGARPAIHGVAEVSTIIAEGERNEMPLTGLSPNQIVTYLRSIGRSAWVEEFSRSRSSFTAEQSFELSVRSYVTSGFPLILLVDSSRFWKLGSVARCKLGSTRNESMVSEAPGTSRADHAVLVVGISHRSPATLLINDPATCPFLEVPLAQLMSATSRKDGAHPLIASMIPVLPHPIQLSLDRPRTGTKSLLPSLLDHAEQLQRRSLIYPIRWTPGRFMLMQAKDVQRLQLPDQGHEAIRAAMGSTVPADHWFWLQMRGPKLNELPKQIWIWDAEAKVPANGAVWDLRDDEIERRYLRGIVRNVRDKWQPERLSPTSLQKHVEEIRLDVGSCRSLSCPILRPAMISSADVVGSRRCVEWWPHGVACELYAFSHRDELFAEAFSETQECPSVVDRMARLLDDPAQIRELAERIVDSFNQRASPIIGLASFVPEIIPIPKPPHQSTTLTRILKTPRKYEPTVGAKAVGFLVRFAGELAQLQERDSVNIELVGGSSVAGVWTGTPLSTTTAMSHYPNPQEPAYYVNRYTNKQGIDLLMRTTRHVLEASGLEPRKSKFVLSYEMEPGGNYVLGAKSDLDMLLDQISDNDPISKLIGINLDISHWILMGIDPIQLMDPTSSNRKRANRLIGRISHAHISDVALAHFGDTPLGELSGYYAPEPGSNELRVLGTLEVFQRFYGRYKEWLDLISYACDLKRRCDYLPPFSGYVSVELEAARSRLQALLSLERLHSLLWFWQLDDVAHLINR